MSTSSPLEYFKRIPLWIYLLLLGFITFYTLDINIAADMTWYMSSALNIFLGKGHTDIDGSVILYRGPLFPLMISACYWMLGPSPWSAFWVVRIFCILNPIIVYFIGKSFFGKGVGFAAALLILTSYSMDFHSYRHIDAVWPFFVLAANYFTYQGFEKRDLKLFLVSGVCLGVAFLIKEVAILFFPLPLLMFLWIAEYRKREILKGVAANILVAIIVVGPWLFYLWQYDSLASLIGGAAPEVVKDIVQPIDNGDKGDLVGYMQACLSAIKEYGAGLARYYSGGRSSLHSNFLIAPGFLLAWLFMLFKAGKGDRHSKILVLNSLLFLPILYYVGKNDFRLGQTVLFLLLSYLALTTLLQWAFERVSALTIDTAKFRHALFCIAVVCLLSIQVLAEARRDLGYKGFIDRSLLLTLVKGEQVTWRVRGTFGDELLKEAIQEIQRLTSVNDGIMVSWYTHARTSYFGLAGKHPVSRMPLLFCHEDGIFFDRKRNYENEKPLWINSNYIPFTLNYMLFMLFESDLLEEIEKKNVKYVLLTPKLCQLNDYFYRSSSFEEISAVGPEKKPRKMYRLYRVEGYDKLEQSFSPVFTKKFRKTMEKLQSHDKKRYEYFRDKYIYDLASISPYEFSDCDSDSR